MDSVWIPYGCFMDSVEIVSELWPVWIPCAFWHGLCMDCVWLLCGLRMVSEWILCRVCLDSV